MSLQGEQLTAAPPIDHDIEQLLLGLADGSYVLSTPDGVVAECGVGAGALLGAGPEELAGHPVPELLASGGDPAQRAVFEQLLHGNAHGTDQRFAALCADGSTRSLRYLVVSVPLALGWEFTSLLSELGSRDADSWQLEELRMRHERALEAVQAVCRTGVQPDSGGRLAGILVVISDSDAPPLTREGVGERMERHREVAREAKEAARRAELGLDEAPDDDAGGLEDLVERAQMLRARLEEAELQATEAYAERDRLQAQFDELRSERDAGAGQLSAEHEQALAQLAAAEGEREQARAELAAVEHARDQAIADLRAERSERERTNAALQAEQAQALARLAEAEAERDLEAQRRAAAESHATTTQDGRLRELACERDSAREEARAGRGAVETAAQQLRAAAQDAVAARGEQALASGKLAAMRGELDTARGALEAARSELAVARSTPAVSPDELQAARAEIDARTCELAEARRELGLEREQAVTQGSELAVVRNELDATLAAAEELRGECERALQRAAELQGEADRARAAADAIRAEFAFEPPPTAAAGSKPLRNPFAAPPKPLKSHPLPASQQAPPKPAPQLPACEPGIAAALIGLDGTFKLLDEAFCSLLGCGEDELRHARWPSIIDRDNLKAHQEIARALRAGEIASAAIETVYMHKRGLLVPVDGTVSMVRDAAGQATHFLFRADVRRTSGAPA